MRVGTKSQEASPTISLTVPTATTKSRVETETDAVKLDLAMRFMRGLKRATETGNNKKLRVICYTRPQPERADMEKTKEREKCRSHTYGPDH